MSVMPTPPPARKVLRKLLFCATHNAFHCLQKQNKFHLTLYTVGITFNVSH